MSEEMTTLIKRLKRTGETISYLNEISSNGVNMQKIKTEIKLLGWQGILNKYHPDINLEENSYKLFQLYRYLYKLMEKYE